MNRDHFENKKGLGSLHKREARGAKKGNSREKAAAPSDEARLGGQPPRRVSPFPGIPVVRQTVIAVVICCIVFLAAGFALFSATQKEINGLKSDLKAYTADGVVSAGYAGDSLNLCIEAIGARVTFMEDMMAKASDGTMSNSDFQWFGSELTAVKKESETLGKILDEIDADSDVEASYNDEIQEPLTALQTAYDGLEISDDDVASTDLGNSGAATDTGSFKLQTGIKGAVKWIVILAIVIVLAVLIFLFRKKIGSFIDGLFGKKDTNPAKKAKKEKKGKQSGNRNPAVNSEADHSGAEVVMDTVTEVPAAETEEVKKRSFAFEEPAEEAEKTVTAQEKQGDPLDLLAPSFRKMAEMEKAKAAALKEEDEAPKAPPVVAEEDLMDFDPTIDNQSEIDDAEDPLFTKGEED